MDYIYYTREAKFLVPGWMENGERTENFERWEAHWEYDLLNGTNCRIEDI